MSNARQAREARRLSGEHVYLSTACYHRLHEQCRQLCKFCPAQCVCACHTGPPK